MVRRSEPELTDRDERLGEAIEAYLALAEAGSPPDPEAFAASHPGMEADVLAALEGLALVKGLVGEPDHGHGPGGRLETGRRIAGYRIVRELGRGGMGVVYEAVHVGLDRPVALKVLGTNAAPDSNGRRRFLNEARTAAGLHHTHIVPVFDVGQMGGLCYYAMQRIEGSGLDRVIRHLRRGRATAAGTTPGPGSAFGVTPVWWSRLGSRLSPGWRASAPPSPSGGTATGPWPGRGDDAGLSGAECLTGSGALSARAGLGSPRRAEDDGPPPFEPPQGGAYYRWVAEVGRQAAEALGYAHRRGVIHRDVKPSNLLVDGRGIIWVADFGLARRLADPGLTQHDSLLGTPRYMSPEQARTGPIDGRTDLFSLGATLYEMLTLRPPFEGRSAAELLDQINRVEPAPPRLTDPKVPRDLETIVLKLLSKRPADRYETAGEVAEDLTRFLNFEPVLARRISPIGRLWRFAQRHPGISVVSTAAAVAVLSVSTVAYVRVRQERDRAVQAKADTVAALRTQYWQAAKVVRFSNVPDRRATGLQLIRDSAALKPEAGLRGRLRNEAAEFLVLRDAEARPALETGRTRGLAFGPDGSRLVALTSSGGGRVLSVWDPAASLKVAERPLRAPSGGEADIEPGPPGGQRRRGGDRDFPFWPAVATAGPNVAVVAPDGQGIGLFDASTWVRARDLKMPGRRILGLLASADGRRLVTVGHSAEKPGSAPPDSPLGGPARTGAPWDRDRRGFEVNLWDPGRTDQPLKTLAHWDAPSRPGFPLVGVSPDGATVATAWLHETAVALWASDTGAPLGTIETQTELTALALGPDNQLATAGNGEVRLWDTDTRTALPGVTPNQSMVRLLRFSPRGSVLAVIGFQGRDIELWDTAAHTPVAVLPTPDPVDDVAFSPDGTTLAASTQGTSTLLWNLVESGVRHRLGGFDTVARSISFRADGLLALGSWKGTIRFWDSGRFIPSNTPPTAGPTTDPTAPAGGSSGIDSRSEKAPDHGESVGRDGPASLAFDDLGRLITLETDSLRVWVDPPRCPGGAASVPLPAAHSGMRLPPPLAPAHGGRIMALARGPQVLLWNSSAPDRLDPVTMPSGRIRSGRSGRPGEPGGFGGPGGPGGPFGWRALTVSRTGNRLYLIDGGGHLSAWSLEKSRATHLLWPAPPTDATTLALSPDGAVLAVGTRSGGLALIDTASGVTRTRLTPPLGDGEGWVWSLAFSPDGHELAVGTQQGHINLWSLDAPAELPLRLPGHRGFVAALAYDPGGHHLASAGSDKTVDVWNLDRLRDEFNRLGLGPVKPADGRGGGAAE